MKPETAKATPNEDDGKIADEPLVHVAIPKVVLGDHPVVQGSRKAVEDDLGGRVKRPSRTA